jgi:hypothetical protein
MSGRPCNREYLFRNRSIDLWQTCVRPEALGILWNTLTPCDAEVTRIVAPETARNQHGSKLGDAVTTVTTLSSLTLKKKDKERTERGIASPNCVYPPVKCAESVSRSSPRHAAYDFNGLRVT